MRTFRIDVDQTHLDCTERHWCELLFGSNIVFEQLVGSLFRTELAVGCVIIVPGEPCDRNETGVHVQRRQDGIEAAQPMTSQPRGLAEHRLHR